MDGIVHRLNMHLVTANGSEYLVTRIYAYICVLLRCLGTVYRGKLSFLRNVVKIIMHVDAMYLFSNPHREYRPISEFSVDVYRPIACNDVVNDNNNDNNDENDGGGDWDDIDTGNVFSSFDANDVVEAWFDDKFYTATIVEVDHANELFTLLFLDDQQEIDSYKACWMKHLQ